MINLLLKCAGVVFWIALQNAWLIILPQDRNFTAYYPEMLSLLRRVVLFWQS